MNIRIRRSLILAGVLSVVLPLCLAVSISETRAASFDCAKATTKVEHLICDTPELSTLDDELSAAYKTALQDKQRAESIRQAQKQWIRERNSCADADCLKRAYVEQLRWLADNVTSTKYEAVVKTNCGFSGQWHLELCDKSISEECGGFTVYLIQKGKKICGDHFFATPGMGRINEGAPRSIVGSVTENNIANIVITSGRNGAIYRVRAIENGDILNWKILEEIKPGTEGESGLILDKGNLKREMLDDNYQSAFSACENH